MHKLFIGALVVVITFITPHQQPKVEPYVIGPKNSAATNQIAYAKKYYDSPNTKHYPDLIDVDCANFVSQTLIARGWKMDEDWWYRKSNNIDEFARPWLSSTALNNYLESKPDLARALSWSQKSGVVVGDIVQFDWDNSGDRDHTAVVSGILIDGYKREILITSHSPGEFNLSITEQLGRHGPESKVYFWHLKH